ncbi:hypothetical protein D3C81_1559980 [compost metagenome]
MVLYQPFGVGSMAEVTGWHTARRTFEHAQAENGPWLLKGRFHQGMATRAQPLDQQFLALELDHLGRRLQQQKIAGFGHHSGGQAALGALTEQPVAGLLAGETQGAADQAIARAQQQPAIAIQGACLGSPRVIGVVQ